MSLKQFPFFLLYLVSSISLADYSAPASVQGNVNLIKSAIGQLKNIGDQVISHINQTQKLASFCGQLRVNGIQNLDPQFKEFQGKDLRSQISLCQDKIGDLILASDLSDTQIKSFIDSLNDAKYSNFSEAKVKIQTDAQEIQKRLNSSRSYLKQLSEVLNKKALDILNRDYQMAINRGELTGKIMGLCTILNRQVSHFNLLIQLLDPQPDYGMVFQLYAQIKGVSDLNNVIKNKCGAGYEAADYSTTLTEVQTILKKINSTEWVKKKCKSSSVNSMAKDVCHKYKPQSITNNQRLINILMAGDQQ